MAIEHQRVIEPVYVENRKSIRAVVDKLLDNAPNGVVLPVGRHIFSSPEEHKIEILTVLKNGHGLLRTVAEDVDVKTACDTIKPVFINNESSSQIILDSVPGHPTMQSIKHILIYTPGRSPIRRV